MTIGQVFQNRNQKKQRNLQQKSMGFSDVSYSKPNIDKAELQTLQQLKADKGLVIMTRDKGVAVVVME